MQNATPISAYLTDTMTERGVTPEELAQKLGYRQPFFVKRWVDGRSLPPLKMLEPIVRALNISAGELLVVWVMTQDLKLSFALKEEVFHRMSPAKRRAAVRKVLADPGRASLSYDPIDEGEPGDGD